MHVELFQKLGLAQNEARIYETLLREGKSGVSEISTSSQVHRRNVYDSINRLMEKGLVFEIRSEHENLYQAVDPHKLSEVLEEKQRELDKVMPSLEDLYSGTPRREEVYIYRGVEGWKNYMRDILRIGKDVYGIGAKAPLNRENFKDYFDYFIAEMRKLKIEFYNLYDHEVKGTKWEGHLGQGNMSYRFLPAKYSTESTTIILEDRVFLFSGITLGNFKEDYSFTVIINPQIAEAHRAWFKFMWEYCEKPSKKK